MLRGEVPSLNCTLLGRNVTPCGSDKGGRAPLVPQFWRFGHLRGLQNTMTHNSYSVLFIKSNNAMILWKYFLDKSAHMIAQSKYIKT